MSAHPFLNRLELQGFKSFAQKTVLEFPARVVAIVGPNGSGKSNVIDAFRWVLGEREAKQLRGDTLGNLIFAGTPKRPAVSVAKVSLFFDNRAGVFPDAGEEVMLARRVDRSGTSQFFIHDTETKLKDLLPMLARARLGSRGLTMVSQGQSDLFVKSSAEERRGMIEEVIGLREFRVKKAQAERRLITSRINMDKVRALLDELTPHLRFLRRQRSRWEKRSELAAALTNLENRYFAVRLHELRQVHEILAVPETSLEDQRREIEGEVHKLEQLLANMDYRVQDSGTMAQHREMLSSLIAGRAVSEKELARIEARMEFAPAAGPATPGQLTEFPAIARAIASEIRTTLAWDDLEHMKGKLRKWLGQLERLLGDEGQSMPAPVADLQKSAERVKADLARIDQEIAELQREADAQVHEQQRLTKEFRSQVELMERQKNELRRIDEQVQRHQFEREKLSVRREELEREWESIGRARADLASLPESYETVDLQDLSRRMLKLRGELAAIGEIDEGLVKDAEETESRHGFLSRELHDLEEASKDLTGLIKDLDGRIHTDFKSAFRAINEEFNNYFRLMFGGGRAHLALTRRPVEPLPDEADETVPDGAAVAPEFDKVDPELTAGVEIELSLPRKRITSLDMLSGGERSLVSIAALFALIAVTPPPFLVLDEIDAALDEENARRFAELVKEFAKKTQFIIVTHNRATMEAADILYGITMGDDGVSKVFSLKLETAEVAAR